MLMVVNLLTIMDVMLIAFIAQSSVPFNNGPNANVKSVR